MKPVYEKFMYCMMRTIWPFYGALTAALLAVTYVPGFSMWLPTFFGYN